VGGQLETDPPPPPDAGRRVPAAELTPLDEARGDP
jgi:hypothetical protein